MLKTKSISANLGQSRQENLYQKTTRKISPEVCKILNLYQLDAGTLWGKVNTDPAPGLVPSNKREIITH
jgi:hypothetical protein